MSTRQRSLRSSTNGDPAATALAAMGRMTEEEGRLNAISPNLRATEVSSAEACRSRRPPPGPSWTGSGRSGRQGDGGSAPRWRPGLAAGSVLALAVLAGGLAAALVQAASHLDEDRLAPTRASTVYTDRSGVPLRVELGADGQWQLPVPLCRMSPWLTAGVPATEDRRFWTHHGVDWLAAVRAAHSNATAGRIVSGASTLTMQLVRLANPERRGWWAKGRQILRALRLESRHPKEWILETYLNQAPFGGNLVGVEAAARAYFGKAAANLSLAEAALLIGIPQRPAAFRPDRHPAAAQDRRRRVLERLTAAGMISSEQARQTAQLPLGVVPRRPGEAWHGLPRREMLFCALAAQATPRRGQTVVTTLDRAWQEVALTALTRQVGRLPGVEDGAAIIIENPSGAVRAMVGSLDLSAPGSGWVNAAGRPRSPGSALKPFIAAAAIDAGLVLPETLVVDEPLTHADYRPENFDGRYRGRVSLREALSRSLNTPAVRLLHDLEPAYVHTLLLRCGFGSLARRPTAELELSLALGTGEVTLMELTEAYAGLARGGLFGPAALLADTDRTPPQRVFSPGAAALVIDMLATYPLPGAPRLPVAWKTGTSNGQRDAWCVALNRDLTVGVWLGNKSGRPADSLVGVTAAAPVVADILNRLCAGSPTPTLPPPVGTEPAPVCARSGLPPGPACTATQPAWRVVGVPTRRCPACARGLARPDPGRGRPPAAVPELPRILSPRPGAYLAQNGVLRLPFTAARDEVLLWFVDGEYVGRFAGREEIALAPGIHHVRGVRPGTSHAVAVSVRVDPH